MSAPSPSGEATGIVIVGGGLAGLFCALQLAPRPVTLITAAPLGQGASTAWAQGGIAAAVAEGDTPEAHWRDTVAAGAGLVDEAIALGMVREAPARIADLLRYGVPFDRDLEGRIAVAQEAAHSARRIVHVRGDMAGHAILNALAEAVRRTPSIRVIDHLALEDLLMADGICRGIVARDLRAPNHLVRIAAQATVLATGGIGQLYAVTTNPPQATGSGLAVAARAGAHIGDAEFVQFHPTAILTGADPAPLATEALRGEGARLVNETGQRFMLALHPDAELAPRDVVARGVHAQIAAGHRVFLDATAAIGAAFADHFPTVYATCKAAGIDPARQPIPIAPAVHYHMGGVSVDAQGRTSLPGLWAAGEVACTGAHGANRLASNSLLEAVVFAARVAEDLSGQPAGMPAIETISAAPPLDDPAARAAIRRLMTANVGVIRDGASLASAVTALERHRRRFTAGPLQQIATSALLIAASAWERRESRGAHFRSDFPQTDPTAVRRTLTLADAARIAATCADRPPSATIAAA